MRGHWLIFAACVATGHAVAGEAVRVVSAADTRSGPGAYYAAGVRLLAGASVRIENATGGWVQADIGPKQTAWIPAYVLEPSQTNPRVGETLRTMSTQMLRALSGLLPSSRSGPTYVNRAIVTIGVRGFSSAYATHRGGKAIGDADATLWESPAFEPQAYQEFLAARFAGRDWEALKKRLPLDKPAPMPDGDADKLGAALATFVARQDGLIRNPALEAYLSEIAQLVAESSHAYDLPVHVYVLNSSEPKGFVSPNGIVFVSAGALRKMQSEAEFAFFVGHEIAHIAFGHGMKKIQHDEQRQRESQTFDEMEHELGWDERKNDRYVRTNDELSELADQVNDYFQHENNDADELEADYWGLIYAARAGYVPEAAESLLLRIVAGGPKGDTGLLWNGVSRERRLEACRKQFAQIKVARSDLRTFDAEFRTAVEKKKAAGS